AEPGKRHGDAGGGGGRVGPDRFECPGRLRPGVRAGRRRGRGGGRIAQPLAPPSWYHSISGDRTMPEPSGEPLPATAAFTVVPVASTPGLPSIPDYQIL